MKAKARMMGHLKELMTKNGTPYAKLSLHAGQMMLLHWQPAQTQQRLEVTNETHIAAYCEKLGLGCG